MQLSPRYDGPTVLRVEGLQHDLSAPLLRQRRRLVDLLATLSEEQWVTPSRCDAWSVRDVVEHLVGVDRFWHGALSAGLAGEPTRHLIGFDPVATPAAMVAGAPERSTEELLDAFRGGVEALGELVSGLDDAAWDLAAEAPPGHLALGDTVRHALWDAWIHERDIVLPLGLAPVEEPDEVTACLEYAVGLGPAFRATGGSTRAGLLAVAATDPTVELVVEVGPSVLVRHGAAPTDAAVLAGRAADLVEALSVRAALRADLAADDRWLLGGLGAVFDQAPAPS